MTQTLGQLRPLTVADVMTASPFTVAESATFHEMATLMRENGVSGLPVLDADGRLAGIVSEADLLLREAPPAEPSPNRLWPESHERRVDRAKSHGTCAAEVMTRRVITVTPQSSLSAAARLMREHAVRRLPVVDREGTLVGIASRGDLLTVFTRSDEAHVQ
jgi:CBS domain-containing protein